MAAFPGLEPPREAAPGRIAVLDWGIGGTGTLARLLASPGLAAAGTELLYLSDSGFTPYGLVSRPGLLRRLRRIVRALREAGVSRLAVACNAMSVAVPDLERAEIRGIGVFDIIRPGVKAVLDRLGSGGGGLAVGVAGGARTIRSGAWSRPLRESGHAVLARIAQPLSALIERGLQGTGEFRTAAWKACRPFARPDGTPRIGTLVLACTHYPAAAGVFRSLLPGADIFDPAAPLAASVLASLGIGDDALPPAAGRTASVTVHAYTTGDPGASAEAALAAFGTALRFRRSPADLE